MTSFLAALTFPAIKPVAFEIGARPGLTAILAGLLACFIMWDTYARLRHVPAKVYSLLGLRVDAGKIDRLWRLLAYSCATLAIGSAIYLFKFFETDHIFFTFSVKWYGLAYMAGLILGWLYIKRLLKDIRLWRAGTAPFEQPLTDDLLLWITLSVILGGRLGQVLLYDPGYYFAHPGDIVQVWKGGMSFHGALIGSGAAILLFARHFQVPARSVMDLCCAAVPFGLFFGRVANFINAEHWGRETDAAIGMVFPNGGPLPRHPSQLYEAALEGLVMFVILRVVTHTMLGLKRPGLVTGVFLAWYAIARTICEFFREPEAAHALNLGPFTAGQMYSIPMLLLGLWFIATSIRDGQPEKAQA